MAWPDGVSKDMFVAIREMYNRYNIGAAVEKEEFKELVSQWLVDNPTQARGQLTTKERQEWGDFMYRHFWADAKANLQRQQEQTDREERQEAERQQRLLAHYSHQDKRKRRKQQEKRQRRVKTAMTIVFAIAVVLLLYALIFRPF